MIVPSLPFLAFAAAAAALHGVLAARWWRQGVLLAANLAFLASFSPGVLALVPFACFVCLGYAGQAATRDGSAPRLFVLLLAVTLAAFFWLKRYSFFPASSFIGFPYVLVGLSYVFFRVMHLLIDSHLSISRCMTRKKT